FHNKTILEKPFNFDINPIYSVNTESLTGSFSFAVNQNRRNSNLFNIRYYFSGSYFHYERDAAYLRLNPSVVFRIRESDFRDNRKQSVVFRQVIVHRDPTIYEVNEEENYSVFNARYSNTRTELTNHFNLNTDLQLSGQFGKLIADISFRKLYEDNRQLNMRLYAGTFLYNKTKGDYFSFALDRPTDYLFDYNYLGRSESTGLYSQQYIIAEGGFKSKLKEQFANEWMSTLNAGYSIWNWIEAYGDVGLLKNRHGSPHFVYDSGIRLNLVQDYFELYFPVYSNNGWEIAQPNYNERIRFIITLSPRTLTNLITRKWL
ncbi:MAG TPA: aminopeptidase, partial [Flavobacterium sp.]|nr:aminopeptidase [Flavobacterium sp.]